MTFEEAWEQSCGDGWLTEPEARLLWETALLTQGRILEVGVYKGKSTTLLAMLNRIILTVDPFSNFDSADMSGDQIQAIFQENLSSRGIQNVFHFRVKIEDWNPQQVSFAYLDGDHTYQGTLNQIGKAKEAGAIDICIHDYSETGGGLEVKRAIETFHMSVIKRVERMVYVKENK